jgi:hypothetical protein
VIVADCFSNKVLLVSREGEVLDTLLDELNQPTGLANCEQHHLQAVAEWETPLLRLYQF